MPLPLDRGAAPEEEEERRFAGSSDMVLGSCCPCVCVCVCVYMYVWLGLVCEGWVGIGRLRRALSEPASHSSAVWEGTPAKAGGKRSCVRWGGG